MAGASGTPSRLGATAQTLVCEYGVMLRRSALAVIVAVTAVTVLVGCADSVTPEATPSPGPSVNLTPNATEADEDAESDPDACADPAVFHFGIAGASITGSMADRGVRQFAEGTVGMDAAGEIVTYTVAAGDAPLAIGERLCIENAMVLPEFNHVRYVQPGQVLRLTADPDLMVVPYYNPWDAAEGFLQIPYQEAIEAMGAAADRGDVDTMRAIWNDTLSGMFTDPADIAGIQHALDAGDLDVLTQMFS